MLRMSAPRCSAVSRPVRVRICWSYAVRSATAAGEVSRGITGSVDQATGPRPGALWGLYVLRSWVHATAEEVPREFGTAREYAEAHAVVAGVADPPGPAEVRDMVDAVLRGVATGDFATTLDRAAAFARIIATGRAHLADDGHERVLSASKLVETADQLQIAARSERAGHLW